MLARRTWERTARSGPMVVDNTKGVPQSARSVMSVFSDASSLLTHRVDVSHETLVNAVKSRMTTTFSSCMIRKADAKCFIIMTVILILKVLTPPPPLLAHRLKEEIGIALDHEGNVVGAQFTYFTSQKYKY